MKFLIYSLIIASLLDACNSGPSQADIQKAKQMAVDSMNQAAATKKRIVDSMKREQRRERVVRESSTNTGAASTETVQPAKKKGMSDVAKGAIIGAGVGAVTGAVVDKKHGEGAVVGGLIGAGAGAATGAVIQKKKKTKHKVKPVPAQNQ